MSKIIEFFNSILDIIFPPRCIVCNRNTAKDPECKICDSCINILNDYKLNRSIRDKDGHEIGMGILRYDGLARFLTHKLKFKKDKRVAAVLAEVIYDDVKKFCSRHHANYIVPIPIHPARLKERGFNQSELIAKILGKRLNIIVRNDLIERTRLTSPQSLLKGSEKRANVKGSFGIINNFEIEGKDIILFDDIYTTGSTIEECSKLLIEHNTRKVYFLSVNISNNKI